jgi:hypothetical protein
MQPVHRLRDADIFEADIFEGDNNNRDVIHVRMTV